MASIKESRTTVASLSGERRRANWDLHLKRRAEVNMFSHDHRLHPRVPQPTSFDGVKPSFVEWSQEVITFLAVTDYHELILLLSAGLKENLEPKKQKKTSSFNFFCDALCFLQLQETQTSWSEKACGLQTQIQAQSLDWRLGVKWLISSQGHRNPERSHCSSRSCHLWNGMLRNQRMSFSKTITGWSRMERISKYEALNGEKITDTVKITLALQNVRGNLAPSALRGHKFILFSSTTSTTQPPLRLKTSIGSRMSIRRRMMFFKTGKGKGQEPKGPQKGKGSKDPQAISSLRRANRKGEERPSRKAKVNEPLGAGIKAKVGIRSRVIKRATKVKMEKARSLVKYMEDWTSNLSCWWISSQQPQQGNQDQQHS